jgi:hypothetical protein
MRKVELDDVRIDQTMTIYRTGSIKGGTIKSGVRVLELSIDVDSAESPETVSELIRVARESCFTHGALVERVEIQAALTLNGERVAS